MDNYTLLRTIPPSKQLEGLTPDELTDAWEALLPVLHGDESLVSVAIAYHLGLRQGIHNERERRKENKGLTTAESNLMTR